MRGSTIKLEFLMSEETGLRTGFLLWKSERVTYEAFRREVALNAAESNTTKTNAARYFTVRAFRSSESGS